MTTVLRGERIGRTAKLRMAVTGFIFDTTRTRLLLTRRSDNGAWCLPGGGMEPGETPAEAVVREVMEETGLQVRAVRVIGVSSDPNMVYAYPDGNLWQAVELDYECEITGGALDGGVEVTDQAYFSLSEMALIDVLDGEGARAERALLGAGKP